MNTEPNQESSYDHGANLGYLLLLVAALLANHAALTRALPNLLMDERWQTGMNAMCRQIPGCTALSVSESTQGFFWARRTIHATARAGAAAQVTGAIQSAIRWPASLYVTVEVTEPPVPGGKK